MRLSDAKEWLIRLQQVDKKSFSTIHTIRGVVRPAFQLAVDDDLLKAVNLYTQALTLLDQYDHQSLEKPEGNQPIYRITYADCRAMVDRMEDSFKSDVFGVEKEPG